MRKEDKLHNELKIKLDYLNKLLKKPNFFISKDKELIYREMLKNDIKLIQIKLGWLK